MPQEYIQHDINLIQNNLVLKLQETGNVEFQFPPRLTADHRRGTWEEGELRGTEPIAVFSTSGPREMTLEWTYVIDGNLWTSNRIHTNVTNVRGYFAQVRDNKNARQQLIVKFKMWKIGGDFPMTARIKGINVKYAGPIIGNPDNAARGNLSGPHFMRTDISIDLRLWTSGVQVDEKNGTSANAKIVQNIPGLNKGLSADWF